MFDHLKNPEIPRQLDQNQSYLCLYFDQPDS